MSKGVDSAAVPQSDMPAPERMSALFGFWSLFDPISDDGSVDPLKFTSGFSSYSQGQLCLIRFARFKFGS